MADGDFKSMPPEELVKVFAGLPFPEKRKLWVEISDLSEQQFEDLFAWQKSRQADVPKVGDIAPDFELDVMDRDHKRTGEKISLSGLRGEPVGLIFGSYT